MNTALIFNAPTRRPRGNAPSRSWTFVGLILLIMGMLAHSAFSASSEPAAPIPPDVVAAIKSLKDADAAARQKVYDLIALKGDARLIATLKAYRDGSLQLRDDKLLMYGDRVVVPGKGSMLPLVDALTQQPVPNPDGTPMYFARPDLSKAMKSPPRLERPTINELIGSLSLLDPDPKVRIESIRDVGEKAARAIPDPDDTSRFKAELQKCAATFNGFAQKPASAATPAVQEAQAAIAAAMAEQPAGVAAPAPSKTATDKVQSTVRAAQDAIKAAGDTSGAEALTSTLQAARAYQDHIEAHQKILDELPKVGVALRRQLEKEPNSQFTAPLKEAIATIDLVSGKPADQLVAAQALGKIGTSRAANVLHKVVATTQQGDKALHAAAVSAVSSAETYQSEVHFIQNTFAGLSLGSILVLMALGLSIIFGLMGVINMAQGEFMMVGAFTTLVVANLFKSMGPAAYNYYLLAAVPAAFIVSGLIGYAVEWLVIRHLYGRPLETLLATWGIGLVMIWAVRRQFGDNVSVAPPRWMEGGWEVAPDLVFPLNRLSIIIFCAICIAVVYYVVNGTKLGLLLRATTQNREMANALGVPTRRIDGLTFAFGAGLAGLAGVAVPLYNKINPNVGQEYIVDCFMVVVVGGVGKLAGAIWAGLGLGFIGKYLEPILGSVPMLASGASVLGKVLVLGLIICFLQWRPQGLFPPKGRNADA